MTVRSLELGLANGILEQMGLFNRKKNVEKEEEQIDEGRRAFLKKSVENTAKVGAVTTGVSLLPKIANAFSITPDNSGSSKNYLMAANIEESHMMTSTDLGEELMGVRGKDKETRIAMHQMTAIQFFEEKEKEKINTLPPGINNSHFKNLLIPMWDVRKDRAELHKYLGIHSIREGKSPLLTNPKIFKEEPAVYLLTSFMYDNCHKYITNFLNKEILSNNYKLNKNDLPIIHFAKGMSKYTSAYIFLMEQDKKTKGIINVHKDIEKPFLNSIFSAAGNIKLSKKFKKNPKEALSDAMNLLYNQNNKNQLIASWSSKWLVDHYYISGNTGIGNLVFENIERPLRNMTGRIRAEGPNSCYYSQQYKV